MYSYGPYRERRMLLLPFLLTKPSTSDVSLYWLDHSFYQVPFLGNLFQQIIFHKYTLQNCVSLLVGWRVFVIEKRKDRTRSQSSYAASNHDQKLEFSPNTWEALNWNSCFTEFPSWNVSIASWPERVMKVIHNFGCGRCFWLSGRQIEMKLSLVNGKWSGK